MLTAPANALMPQPLADEDDSHVYRAGLARDESVDGAHGQWGGALDAATRVCAFHVNVHHLGPVRYAHVLGAPERLVETVDDVVDAGDQPDGFGRAPGTEDPDLLGLYLDQQPVHGHGAHGREVHGPRRYPRPAPGHAPARLGHDAPGGVSPRLQRGDYSELLERGGLPVEHGLVQRDLCQDAPV